MPCDSTYVVRWHHCFLFSLPIAIALGMYANPVYKAFVEQKIRKIESLATNNLEHELIKRGRTSIVAACGIFVVMVLLLSFIFLA